MRNSDNSNQNDSGLTDTTEHVPPHHRAGHRRLFLGLIIAVAIATTVGLSVLDTIRAAKRSPERGEKVESTPVANTGETPEPGSSWRLEGLGLNMIWIEPGSFLMGSPENESGRKDNESTHRFTIPQGYWLSEFEIRHRDWQQFVDDTGYITMAEQRQRDFGTWVYDPTENKIVQHPSANWKTIQALGPDHPVQGISWHDVIAFCEWLTRVESEKGNLAPGQKYTLPSEVQWEFACRERGNATGPFYFGDSLETHQANFNGFHAYGTKRKGVYLSHSEPVGSYPPNALGLYDMHGNTFEWTLSEYSESLADAVIQPTGEEDAAERCYKGGSWFDLGIYCRAAFRGHTDPTDRSDHMGARLALIYQTP